MKAALIYAICLTLTALVTAGFYYIMKFFLMT